MHSPLFTNYGFGTDIAAFKKPIHRNWRLDLLQVNSSMTVKRLQSIIRALVSKNYEVGAKIRSIKSHSHTPFSFKL